MSDMHDEVVILRAQLAAAIADRDSWVFNAKTLQTGYNELDARLTAANMRIAELEHPDMQVMVNRFLSWSMPKDFGPDGGVSFNRTFIGHDGVVAREYGGPFWPIGTNLFHAGQAKEMIEHILGVEHE